MGTVFQIDGFTIWGFALELGYGLRLRISVYDWEQLGFHLGQRVGVSIPNRFDERLIIADMVEALPVVWITLTHRVCQVQTRPSTELARIRRKAAEHSHRSAGHRAFSRVGHIMSFPRVIERLHHLVLHDQRHSRLGLGGLARVAFQEEVNRVPTSDEIREVVQDFWEYWHEKHDKPQHPELIWAISRRCIRDELSPSQENAIRVLEDAGI